MTQTKGTGMTQTKGVLFENGFCICLLQLAISNNKLVLLSWVLDFVTILLVFMPSHKDCKETETVLGIALSLSCSL